MATVEEQGLAQSRAWEADVDPLAARLRALEWYEPPPGLKERCLERIVSKLPRSVPGRAAADRHEASERHAYTRSGWSRKLVTPAAQSPRPTARPPFQRPATRLALRATAVC